MKTLLLLLISLSSFSFELKTGDLIKTDEEIKVPYMEALTVSDDQVTIKFSSESRFIIKESQRKKIIHLIEGSLDITMKESSKSTYEVQSDLFSFQFNKFNGSLAVDDSGLYIINFESEPKLKIFEPNETIIRIKRNSALEFNYYDKPLISTLSKEQINKIKENSRNPF